NPPFGKIFAAPEMEMGTIGTPASRAIRKPPFLNGCSRPSGLRVPSGYTRKEFPAFNEWTALRTASIALLAVTAVDRDESAESHRPAQNRDAKELFLGKDEHWREVRKDGRRVGITLVIRHEN